MHYISQWTWDRPTATYLGQNNNFPYKYIAITNAENNEILNDCCLFYNLELNLTKIFLKNTLETGYPTGKVGS